MPDCPTYFANKMAEYPSLICSVTHLFARDYVVGNDLSFDNCIDVTLLAFKCCQGRTTVVIEREKRRYGVNKRLTWPKQTLFAFLWIFVAILTRKNSGGNFGATFLLALCSLYFVVRIVVAVPVESHLVCSYTVRPNIFAAKNFRG